MKIYFIRHGETTGDIEDRYGGDYDDDLTKKGIVQANKLGRKLEEKGIQIIYSSPLKRAHQTAKILSEKLQIEIKTLNKIKERNHNGIVTGMIRSEAKKKHPEVVEAIEDYRKTAKGAESYEDFGKRIRSAIEGVYKSDFETVAIVAHGGPMKYVLREILGKGKIKVSDCAYAVLERKDGNIELKSVNGIEFKDG